MINSTNKSEYKALLFSFCMIIILMIGSLFFNELTDSNIIEVDAGSYVISAIIGLVTIYISRLKEKPKDPDHPLGFSGYVPILNLIRSFMIILICIKGISESFGSIYSGPPETNHKIMLSYAILTFVLNGIAFLIIHSKGEKINSALLKTDVLEWKTDIAFNISIITAVFFAYLLNFTVYNSFVNYVDPVFCILFSIVMAYYPIKLFNENVQLLSVSSIDKVLQDQIILTFKEHIIVMEKYDPTYSVLHVGGVLWVNIELNVSNDNIDLPKDYLIIKIKGEKILSEITPDNKISFSFSRKKSSKALFNKIL